jgi:hypothetical protein
LVVDFNFGGITGGFAGGPGLVFLSPKRGVRSGLRDDIREQFEAAGVVPGEGLEVLLVDPRSDADESGTVCDMQVEGTLLWVDDGIGWRASYESQAVRLVPSVNQEES